MNELIGVYLEKVNETIASACLRSGRSANDVTIVAVTKYTDVQGIQYCLDAGLRQIGENVVQHVLPKIEHFEKMNERIFWHFIGHLQSNKVKYILPHVSLIHSLDRLSLAKEIQLQAEKLDREVDCLLQVNVSGEQSKYGVAIEDLQQLAEAVSQYDRIKVKGLMTMAPFTENPEETRSVFAKLRELKEELARQQLPNFDLAHLSMGMSNDYSVAIEEGATLVRLGSVLMEKTD